MYRPPYKESLYGDPGRSGGIVTARYLIGDVLEVLPTLEENSVDLILTSPPFLALRSYLPADHPDKAKEGGSQPTPGAFIDWLVDVVEALDRVLAPHGSMVIELGDTYAGGGGGPDSSDLVDKGHQHSVMNRMTKLMRSNREAWPADKSLTLIPELFRMTLVYGFNPLTGRQTKRWRLRNVIRWVRPNPPVGALGDKFRPATSELMVFCRTDEAGRRRYFDLDAVRTEHKAPLDDTSTWRWQNTGSRADDGQRVIHDGHPAGAPPLDWWNIPPGGYVSYPEAVNPGEYAGGTLYIASAGCPLHEGHPDLVAKASRDGLLDTLLTHNLGTVGSPVQGRLLDSAPIDQPHDQNPEVGSSDSPHPEPLPVATPHSKASRKKAPAPETSSPDTASDRTSDHIGDTLNEPPYDVPHPGNPENKTVEAVRAFLALQTYARTGHKPAELEECRCSFYVTTNSTSHYAVKPGTGQRKRDRSHERWAGQVPHDKATGRDGGTGAQNPNGAPPLDWWEIPPGGYSGSHYAVFPEALCVRPIKAMCPRFVCTTCGQPERRIVGKTAEYEAFRNGKSNLSDQTEARHAYHLADKGGLGSIDHRDDGGARGQLYETLGWSDCGHDSYRVGCVLDPFAGSGTTLAVAVGHGRDAIGIDLDERNARLAEERIGMFLEIENSPLANQEAVLPSPLSGSSIAETP